MKYKVGDWVQLINHKGFRWVDEGEMDRYIGKVVKITHIHDNWFEFDGFDNWEFNEEDIAGYAKNKVVQEIIKDL